MKKIKWLLLFWILSLLWIGSSFWWYIWSVIYELAWYNRNYQFYVWNSSTQYWVYYISWFNSSNIPVFLTLDSFYYSLYSWNLLFNELWIWTWRWSSNVYSPSNNLYYWSDFVSLFWRYNSNLSGSIWNFNNSTNRSTWNYINTYNSLRLFLSTEYNSTLCLFPEQLSNSDLTWFYWWCNIDNYQIFPFNLWYSINSNSNSVYDSTYNSWTSVLNSRKTAVFPWLWQWYSFIYEGVKVGWWFRSVFSWTLVSEDFLPFNDRWYVQNKYIDWQLIFNVNNTTNWWSNWETTIIAIDALRTWYYMYSLYTCPDTIISNCSFIEGWKLYSGNELIIPSFDWSVDSFYNWLNYISTWQYYYLPIVYTSFDDSLNVLTFTRYWIQTRTSSNTPRINFSKSINLVPWELWDNYNLLKYLGIQWWDNSWDWNQSSYSWSVSLNNCVETTTYNYITWSNWEVLRLSRTECLSPEIIESGSYVWSDWTIYYVDSSYNISNISNTDWVVFDTWFLDEDWLLSIDYYSWLFNWNWFRFWVCPYPPSNYLNFATKIKLWNFYPFMPLNCFVSAFQQWVKVHYFDDSWLFPDNHSQLMAWDSHYHRTLFRFFDVLLSIWILLLLSALLRIIKK